MDTVTTVSRQALAQFIVPVSAVITGAILLSPPVLRLLLGLTTSWVWAYVIILLILFLVVYLVDQATLQWRAKNGVRGKKANQPEDNPEIEA